MNDPRQDFSLSDTICTITVGPPLKPMVTIGCDGTVILHDDFTFTDAAKQFWKAIENNSPFKNASIELISAEAEIARLQKLLAKTE